MNGARSGSTLAHTVRIARGREQVLFCDRLPRPNLNFYHREAAPGTPNHVRNSIIYLQQLKYLADTHVLRALAHAPGVGQGFARTERRGNAGARPHRIHSSSRRLAPSLPATGCLGTAAK